jgi:hypothetical protein
MWTELVQRHTGFFQERFCNPGSGAVNLDPMTFKVANGHSNSVNG